jgi:hypothetical protein
LECVYRIVADPAPPSFLVPELGKTYQLYLVSFFDCLVFSNSLISFCLKGCLAEAKNSLFIVNLPPDASMQTLQARFEAYLKVHFLSLVLYVRTLHLFFVLTVSYHVVLFKN